MASPEPGPPPSPCPCPDSEAVLGPNSAIELLFGLPQPLLSFLALASPAIGPIAQLSLLLRWSHPLGQFPSWILLFLWAALSLLIPPLVPFAWPNLLFLLLLILGAISNSPLPRSHPKVSPRTLSSPQAVLDALQAFQTIADHLDLLSRQLTPFIALLRWTDPVRSGTACWACLTSLPCSILLARLIPLKFLVMLIGALAILWPAEWFWRLRTLLWRSALVRWISRLFLSLFIYPGTGFLALYRQGAHHDHVVKLWPPVVSLLSPCHTSGLQPAKVGCNLSFCDDLPSLYHRPPLSPHLPFHVIFGLRQDSDPAASQTTDDGQTLEFRLTIVENQRWWIGLDWTPSLGNDRACWADARHRPVASRAHFALPPPALVGHPDSQRQRRVEWMWRDPDWTVLRARPASSTIGGAPEAPQDTHSDAGSLDLDREIRAECLRSLGALQGAIESPDAGAGWDVDSEGWMYGDNRWQRFGPECGTGKFTRRRAWTRRVAMVTRDEKV